MVITATIKKHIRYFVVINIIIIVVSHYENLFIFKVQCSPNCQMNRTGILLQVVTAHVKFQLVKQKSGLLKIVKKRIFTKGFHLH